MKTVKMVRGKDCKHSVVYTAVGDNPAVTSLYVMRSAFENMPSEIEVTIRATVDNAAIKKVAG